MAESLSLKKLKQNPSSIILNSVESLRLQAHVNGKLAMDMQFGPEHKYYDLASLTKVIFSTTAVMRWMNRGQDPLSTRLDHLLDHCKQMHGKNYRNWQTHLSGDFSAQVKKLKLKNLLAHNSGLLWWNNFFQKEKYKGTWLQNRKVLFNHLFEEDTFSEKKSRYSDVGFVVLGFILEEMYGKDLHSIWKGIESDLNFKTLHFCPNNKPKYNKTDYAPTYDYQWRVKRGRGTTNDINLYYLGGVGAHSGLFGSIEDLSSWGLLIRKSYYAKRGGICRPEVMSSFVKRTKGTDFSLGFMMPNKKSASCGKFFSKSSLGHIGFAGPSFWWDPKKDVMVSILTNKIDPKKEKWELKKLRPLLHDLVLESLGI